MKDSTRKALEAARTAALPLCAVSIPLLGAGIVQQSYVLCIAGLVVAGIATAALLASDTLIRAELEKDQSNG